MKTIEYYMNLPYRLELVPDTDEGGFVWILILNQVSYESHFDPQVTKAAIAAFANELRIVDHAPIPIDLSQFFQKRICHDTSKRNRRARFL